MITAEDHQAIWKTIIDAVVSMHRVSNKKMAEALKRESNYLKFVKIERGNQ